MLQRLALALICAVSFLMLSVNGQDEPPAENNGTRPTLTVWLPAPILSDRESTAFQQLLNHTEQFSQENNVTVEYRVKAIGQMGGIMSTIRSGSAVAPGALPDVTLIRRSDLISAQAITFLQSLENLFSSALLNDLDQSLKLGQVMRDEGLELFGLPYFIDVQLTVSNDNLEDIGTSLTFDDILNHADSFLLPAARNNGLNQIFYLQYLAAGGVPPRNDEMTINANALQTVLEFYESAIQRGIMSPAILDYNSPSAYRTDFINNMNGTNFGIFSSSEYLSLLQQDSGLYAATIPTEGGTTITTLNGWVWVMVTPNPDQQNLSVQYLNWMMETDFHAEFASELNQLPAQQPAVLDSLPNTVDSTLIEDLLNNAILPIPDSESGTVPRAMQEALVTVVNGDATAEQATSDVIEQFNMD